MCVIIIGAGPAGCEAAYRLAQAGETVELIEKESETGGNLNNWYQLFPDRKQARDLNQSLRQNIQRPDIHLHLGNYPVKISRTENNKFTLELNDGALLKGDALLVTSGFRLFNARRKEEYGYGIYENDDHFRRTGKFLHQSSHSHLYRSDPQTNRIDSLCRLKRRKDL